MTDFNFMTFQIKPATRVGIKPLVGIYAESGCGKTMSALLLARGLVGTSGKIVMIDTESGRGSLYADVIPGGYDVIEMREPFSSARYIEAIKEVESSGANVLVIDSASHEWEGIGGVTDAAGEISKARAVKYNKDWDGVIQFGDWKHPKMDHQKFMLKMLQSPLPIIVCLRAKYKSHQTKGTKEMAEAGIIKQNDIGRNVVTKDEFTSPIQAEDFIYEMTAHAEVLKNHSIILTKCSHPSLRDCFPKDQTTPITIDHGKALAAWCNAAGKPAELKSDDDVTALKKELWKITEAKHKGDKATLKQWLIDEIMVHEEWPNATLETYTAAQLKIIIKLAKEKL